MTALVLLLAEIAVEIMAIAIVLLCELVLSILVLCFPGLRLRALRKLDPQAPKRPSRRNWRLAITLLALPVLAITVANYLFFAPTVRFLLSASLIKAGATVDFASALGSLFSGDIQLRDVRVIKAGGKENSYDIRLENIEIDLKLLPLVFGRVEFDNISLDTIRGNFTRVEATDKLRARKKFRIEQLRIQDAQLVVFDHTAGKSGAEFDVRIEELDSTPLRSEWALMDVLLNTDASGTIDNGTFEWRHDHVTDAGGTRWKVDNVPVARIALMMGWPFTYLDDGLFSFVMDSRTDGDSALRVKASVSLRDVHARVPKETDSRESVIGDSIVKKLNTLEEEKEFVFDFSVPIGEFEEVGSLLNTGILDAFNEGFWRAMASSAGISVDRLHELGRKSADELRRNFDGILKRE